MEAIQQEHDIQSLSSIYLQLSVTTNDEFDTKENENFIFDKINSTFNNKFILIDSKILSNDINILNVSFAKLIKTCKQDGFNNIGNIFICYCDFFNLEYNKIYNNLHEKIRLLIKNDYIKMVSKTEYCLQKNKYTELSEFHQDTIFDIFK